MIRERKIKTGVLSTEMIMFPIDQYLQYKPSIVNNHRHFFKYIIANHYFEYTSSYRESMWVPLGLLMMFQIQIQLFKNQIVRINNTFFVAVGRVGH